MPQKSPLVIGHRGASGYRPEHSRSAYELALAMGVGAVEPDVVATKDGVLVVRHENEISETTNVADHPEFRDRRTTKTAGGYSFTGWFTEDFTWDELSTLRTRERLPALREESASHDDEEPILRLSDLLALVRETALAQKREIGVVLEVKHATYFSAIGLDLVPLIENEVRAARWSESGLPLIVESFEPTVLGRLRERGITASYVYLIEESGRPFDLQAQQGDAALTYPQTVRPAGLDGLRGAVDGISVNKSMLLAAGNSIVPDAHERGLRVFTWTCRPENAFLDRRFRTRGPKSAFGNWEAEWRVIADSGVDGVFVDHADLGVRFFG